MSPNRSIAVFLVVLCFLGLHTLNAQDPKPERDHNFQSQNRIYGYLGVSVFTFTETGLDTKQVQPGGRTVPALGLGFSLINFGNGSAFLNLEADYTKALFPFDSDRTRPASALTFICQGELRLGRQHPMSAYMGLGIGILHLGQVSAPGFADSTFQISSRSKTSLALEMGLKYSLMSHLMLRISGRFFLQVRDAGGYWDDDAELWLDDTEYDLLASSLSLGMEFHF